MVKIQKVKAKRDDIIVLFPNGVKIALSSVIDEDVLIHGNSTATNAKTISFGCISTNVKISSLNKDGTIKKLDLNAN